MGLKLISERQHIESVTYAICYDRKGESRGNGYSFLCDEYGLIDEAAMMPAAKASLRDCQEHPEKYNPPYLQEYVSHYTEPARGQCVCGRVVVLEDPMDNDCACGRCYNSSGQEVEPNYGRAECARDGWAYDEEDY